MPESDGHRIRNTAFEALWIGVIQRDLTLFGPM